MSNILPRLLTTAALLATATAALAHAHLEKAVPPVGGTIATSPKEIRLRFSEGVTPRFSSVTLSTKTGAAIPLGKPAVDPADHAVLIVPVSKNLIPGVYKVVWHAVAEDTHRTQGAFNFTVGQ